MQWDYAGMADFFGGENRDRLLLDGLWGLEKEAQRITPDGSLALTPHPAVFGDKLSNPYVTTDFSESQMELVTPPFQTVEELHDFLIKLQTQVEAGIGTERLWPLSMPPRLPDEAAIPIARFGNSEAGREKETYRQGLAVRYGKKMQMISGLHYNFSFGPQLRDELYRRFGRKGGQGEQEFLDQLYFAVARNFMRHRWLLVYLFGASPVADATYNSVIRRELKFIAGCCPEYCNILKNYHRDATSLRVSRFGYSNPIQENAPAFFDNLTAYIQNLRRLLSSQSRAYRELGIYRNGAQMQLNDHVLQKESEFYAPIRFKRNAVPGQTQLEALAQKGVQYLEVRILDLNPFEKTGIGLGQLYFLQVFMLWCLFEASPPFSALEFDRLHKNHHAVALFGRQQGLELADFIGGSVELQGWGREIFVKLNRIAGLMDAAGGNRYRSAVACESAKIGQIALLPSARIQREMAAKRESFLAFGIRRAAENQQIP